MASHRIAIAAIGGVFGVMVLGCDRTPSPGPTGVNGLAVHYITPTIGLTKGPTTVRIGGTGFKPGTTIVWDGVPISTTLESPTVITAQVPAHAAGAIDVVVTNHSGKGVISLPAAFTYVLFEISGINPTVGFPGTQVVIQGNGFRAGATVTFGGVRALAVSVRSPSTIWATAPVHLEGPADIVVTDSDGETIAAPSPFTFQIATLSLTPTTAAPGALISISWTAPAGRENSWDWIGLFKVGSSNSDYEQFWWTYTDGRSSGTYTVSAPLAPGVYEFRYLPNDDYVDVARSAVLTVTAASRGSRN